MNAKLWACVLAGVLVIHLSVLVILANLHSAQMPPPKPMEPTFTTATTTFTNDRGETVKVVNEFTVQTVLATPEMLENLPPGPPATPLCDLHAIETEPTPGKQNVRHAELFPR